METFFTCVRTFLLISVVWGCDRNTYIRGCVRCNIIVLQMFLLQRLPTTPTTWTNSPAADERTATNASIVIPSIVGTRMIYLEAVLIAIIVWLLVWSTRPIGEVPHASIFPLPGAFPLLVWPSDPVPSVRVIRVHLCHQEVVDLHACNDCKTAIQTFTEEPRIFPGSRCSWPDEAMFPESLALFFFLARFHTKLFSIFLTVVKETDRREYHQAQCPHDASLCPWIIICLLVINFAPLHPVAQKQLPLTNG